MRIGSPFNPYKVFQGVFAPYWILEHRGVGSGAKFCHIRLLGFAGKDARCYPSLETLGRSLGVSDRQARDYVKELERAGLIAAEQRGLRRTNVYFFLWTAELENLSNSVPDDPDDPLELATGQTQPYRDRNSTSGLERKLPAGPIGINSVGIRSQKSSSSKVVPVVKTISVSNKLMFDGSEFEFRAASASKPPVAIPALESALRSHPCGALSSVRSPFSIKPAILAGKR